MNLEDIYADVLKETFANDEVCDINEDLMHQAQDQSRV